MRLVSTLCLAAALLAVFPRAGFAQKAPAYIIKAELDAGSKTVTAEQTVVFNNRGAEPLENLYFHIYPNRRYTRREESFMLRYAGYFKVDPFPDGFPRGGMDIREIYVNGNPARYAIEGDDRTLLRVELDPWLRPGDDVSVTIRFALRVPTAYGRLGWIDNIVALSRWYPILSVPTEKGWNKAPFYPFHRPFFSEASNYQVELTVPADYTVVHTGIVEDEYAVGQTEKILHITTDAPVREFTLAASPDYQVLSEEWKGVRINAFYLSGDQARAREALQSARDLMAFYTRRFGPYPYARFSIAPVHLAYGGEQMSNMIFIDTRVFKEPSILRRHFDFLIAHETGHQWFYNLVGIDEFKQIWLEEGVNSYFILQYLEDKYGPDANIMEWPSRLDWLLPNVSFRRARDYRYKIIARTNLDYPVENNLSSYTEPSSIFSITYGKGSAVIAMLRYYIGDEAFEELFRRIFKEYRHGNLLTRDFIRLAEEVSGKDLDAFFDQWLFTAKTFDYAVTGVRGNAVTLENRGGISVPAEIRVTTRDGRERTVLWEGDTPKKTITLEGGSPVRQVVIDPQHRLLDIDRVNNVWPRQVNFKAVPLYLGAYDLSLFNPEDSYNVVAGPEIADNGLGVKVSVQRPYDYLVYAASDYEFGEELLKSRVGYQLKNVFNTRASAGFELFNITDYEDGAEDLVGGKVYFRKELWPVAYSLADINDHVTFYLIRNSEINRGTGLSGREDDRNVSYLRKNEAIVGTALHFDRAEPVSDPARGYRVDTMVEHSGHFLGATQYFNRGAMDVAVYHPATLHTSMAWRVKVARGYPNDKNLFELGGPDGLRGYDRKTVRGASTLLGSVEYRFPLVEKLGVRLLDNIISFESIDGVAFFDAGQAWYKDFDEGRLKKDAGLGLRFHVALGSFLEKIIVRFDAAQAIREPKQDTQFWFGVNHAF